MTAKEIREHIGNLLWPDSGQNWPAESALGIWEIATQLAEANELTRQRLANELERAKKLDERETKMLAAIQEAVKTEPMGKITDG